MANLTPNQIKSLVYNAIGRASEIATVAFNKLVVSVGASGYSIGALQTDFSSNKQAGKDLIAQYQAWAPADKKLTAEQYEKAQGIIVQASANQKKLLDPEVKTMLNAYLASPQGGVWVAARDEAVYQAKLTRIIQPMMATTQYQNLDNASASELLGRISKAFNQNEVIGLRLLDDFKGDQLTTTNFEEKFQSALDKPYLKGKVMVTADQSSMKSGQANFKEGLDLHNALATADSIVGVRWRTLAARDPANLVGLGSDPDSVFFDVLFRDPVNGLNLLNKLETGNFTTGKLIIANKEFGTAMLVGIDKNGNPLIFGKDGSVQRNFKGDWLPSLNGDETGIGAVLRPSKNGKGWILASGLEDDSGILLADTAVATINVNGTDVILDANSGSRYQFDANSDLASVTQDGNRLIGTVLTGGSKGNTYVFTDFSLDADGYGLRNASFTGNPALGKSNNYKLEVSDVSGGVVTTRVRPITIDTDTGIGIVIGSESTVVKKQNDITLSNTKTSTQTDLATGQLVANSDVSQYTPTGEFVSRAVNTVTRSSTGLQLADVKVTFNATGGVTQTSVTELQANGATKTVVRDGQGLIQSTTTRQISDDNSILETTTLPNGQVVQKSLDTEGQLAGTITDTPDGNGGFNRHISTVVDGKTLDVAQHIDASKAAVDKDGDGNFIDAGDATTTGVLIGGQAAVNADQIGAGFDAYYGEGQDLFDARNTGKMVQLVSAGDASNISGWKAPGNVEESCSALKDIAIKSIRTRPRGQLSRKSHAVYAGTRERGPHHPTPRSLAAQGAGVFAGQRLLGTQS